MMKGRTTDMIQYTEALQRVIKEARSFGTERIGLDQADGRVLAETVWADRDYPPFDRSTMDGYAVRSADLEKNIRSFGVAETIFAGGVATRPALQGECYKIMTGAPVPEGMDMVIRREDTAEGPDGMILLDHAGGFRPGQPLFLNIARRGEDLRGGSAVISGPCVAKPAMIGLLASLGKTQLLVEGLPRVALITTGNEIVPADVCPGASQIRNSNRWLLQSLLKERGVDISYYQHAPDDRDLLEDTIRRALSADFLICCGGVSAGDADFVPSVLEGMGIQRLFHKMAIKPGKPTWCGVAPSGTMVFGLPGNPFSCLVNFMLLIRPYLQACYGLPAATPAGLPLGSSRKKKASLDEFFPVCLQGSPGRLLEAPLNGSGDVRLGLSADGLALHPAGSGDLAEGTVVQYYPF